MSSSIAHSPHNVTDASESQLLDEAQVTTFLGDLRAGRLKEVLTGPQFSYISKHPEYVEAFRTGFRLLLQAGNFSDAGFSLDQYGRGIDMDEDLHRTFFGLLDLVDAEQELPLDRLRGFNVFFEEADIESAPDYTERVSKVFIKLLQKKKVDRALQFREMFGMNIPLSDASALARDGFIRESELCSLEDKDKPRAEKKGPLHFLHIPLYRGMTYVFKIIEAAKKEDFGLAAELKKEYDALVAKDCGEIAFSGMFDERSPYHPRVVKGYAEVLEQLAAYAEVPYEVLKHN